MRVRTDLCEVEVDATGRRADALGMPIAILAISYLPAPLDGYPCAAQVVLPGGKLGAMLLGTEDARAILCLRVQNANERDGAAALGAAMRELAEFDTAAEAQAQAPTPAPNRKD